MERTKTSKKINIPDAINQSVTKEFTQVPNELLRNPELSFKAKGILCLLLSNREGWYSYINTIKQMTKEGDEAIRSGLAELENAGFLLRIQYREKDTKIRRGSFWAYTDIPGNFNIQETLEMLDKQGMEPFLVSKSYKENPEQENPDMDTLKIENQALKILNIKIPNYNNNQSYSSEMEEDDGKIKPSHFEDFWQMYPRKDSKGAAKKAWTRLCNRKSKDRPSWDEIESALAAQKKSERWQDKQFIPLPTTWLNQERWEDDPDELVSYGNNNHPSQSNKTAPPKKTPEDIFRQELKKEGIAEGFMEQCYKPAKKLLTSTSNGQLPELAENLIDLRKYIKKEQDRHRDKYDDMEQNGIFMPPNRLIEYYIDWIEENRWIDDREPRLFTPKHKLFQKFLQYQRRLQNDRHPLTGE